MKYRKLQHSRMHIWHTYDEHAFPFLCWYLINRKHNTDRPDYVFIVSYHLELGGNFFFVWCIQVKPYITGSGWDIIRLECERCTDLEVAPTICILFLAESKALQTHWGAWTMHVHPVFHQICHEYYQWFHYYHRLLAESQQEVGY